METVFIIIPYFQREAGILQRALRSIACQQHTDWHVIVSDDESPVSAVSELESLDSFPMDKVTVITNRNGGPAVARNRGLDETPGHAKYVAFLDSDDTWSEDHLFNALTALEQGFDFYFSDLLQLGADTPAFRRAGRITPSEHPSIHGNGLHAFSGDLFNQTLTGNVIGTPTVVYRFDRFNHIRFHEQFTHAGEDYIFWMELQRSGARAAFSEKCEAYCGKGINVYVGSGWGKENSLDRIVDEVIFNKKLRKMFPLSNDQIRFVENRLATLRSSLATDILHRLRHKKRIKLGLIKKLATFDPKSIVYLIPNAVFSLRQKKSY